MDLHVFNPENDLALACFNPNFIPPASARLMAKDLACLPMWWANEGDVVLLESLEGVCEWKKQITDLCPQIECVCTPLKSVYSQVRPWGWSPMLVRKLMAAGVHESILPDNNKLNVYRDLSNRRHAVSLLSDILKDDSRLYQKWGERLCGQSFYCQDEENISLHVRRWRRSILKSPWSGSGKGLRLGNGQYVSPLSGWCKRILTEQGAVVVEPLYNRKHDFALEFYSDGKGQVKYVGLSLFLTTQRGTYMGNRVASEEMNVEWLMRYIPAAMFEDVRECLQEELRQRFGSVYEGYLGVDMMLCEVEGRGSWCVHPCVEVNMRRTMGWVAVQLSNLLPKGTEGIFRIEYYKESAELYQDHVLKLKQEPIIIKSGKLQKGYLPLVPVTESSHYRVALIVESGE